MASSGAAEWDASEYHQLSDPQVAWGRRVLARLDLRGDEGVLDAGCGTGRLTLELADALPLGRVICLDWSTRMLEQARETLRNVRACFVRARLPSIPFGSHVDAVFSTATFHWVRDHPALFREIYRTLRPGGRLVAQCGGAGNLDRLHARARLLMAQRPFAPSFAGWIPPWEFADGETTAARLAAAGFERIETGLEEALTVLPDAPRYGAFLRTVVLRDHLSYIAEPDLREAFISALVRQAEDDDPPFSLDYWRLNLAASKPLA
jgi:trans-aconitate 2-methyltransferase